jgi:SAM-dependent methyltransferase
VVKRVSGEEYQKAMVKQHQEWLNQYGMNEKALGWGSEAGMQARYMAACNVLRLQGGDLVGRSVLDVGCGYGGLLPIAEQQSIRKYVGIDLMREFIDEAVRRRAQLRRDGAIRTNKVTFAVADIFEYVFAADVVVALGVAWLEGGKEFLRSLMKQCFDLCEVAAVISVSHDMTLGEKEGFNLVSPDEFAKFAGELTERFVLRRDYWGTDMMVYMYRRGFDRFEAKANSRAEVKELSRQKATVTLADM